MFFQFIYRICIFITLLYTTDTIEVYKYVLCVYPYVYVSFSLLQQELTVSSTEKKNWRGIFIALLVIVAVLGLILFSIFLLTPGKLFFCL